MKKRMLKRIEERVLRALLEAPSDDDPTARRTKTKVRDRDTFDDTDFYQPPATRTNQQSPAQRTKRKAQAKRYQGPSLDSFRGIRADDMLRRDPGEDFDFDDAFDRGMEQDLVTSFDASDIVEPGEEQRRAGSPHAPRRNQTGDDTPLFQPNAPMGQEAETTALATVDIEDAKTRITRALMDEFVAPAMSRGATILPAVWAELSRLARSNPRKFREQFGSALHQVREFENQWFSDLMDVELPPTYVEPAEGDDKDMRERIVHVLRKYYNAVLSVASANSGRLRLVLEDIIADFGTGVFVKAFVKAIEETRQIEDQAFGSMMR